MNILSLTSGPVANSLTVMFLLGSVIDGVKATLQVVPRQQSSAGFLLQVTQLLEIPERQGEHYPQRLKACILPLTQVNKSISPLTESVLQKHHLQVKVSLALSSMSVKVKPLSEDRAHKLAVQYTIGILEHSLEY